MNYYNELDPKAAAWLRELIKQKLIPNGHVDERSIVDVRGSDLAGYTQCHFFAGIGGWPLALRLAGWPENRRVWTGSCPCQPFSTAGKQAGFADKRHLWPEFKRLIAERKPPVVFGEQVASALGRQWLAGVFADLEGLGYAAAGADLCAAGIGAPHIRQRLFWVADAASCENYEKLFRPEENERERQADLSCRCRVAGGLANAESGGFRINRCAQGETGHVDLCGEADGLGDTSSQGLEGFTRDGHRGDEPRRDATQEAGHTSATICPWYAYDLLKCRDGKSRRIEPGLAPLAHGVPARVVRLRGYGNAIVPPLAAEFIKAYLDVNAL